MLSPAAAGAVAAAVWAAAERPLCRLLGTGYTDVRLLGAPLSARHWRTIGTALHLANGDALFGLVLGVLLRDEPRGRP